MKGRAWGGIGLWVGRVGGRRAGESRRGELCRWHYLTPGSTRPRQRGSGMDLAWPAAPGERSEEKEAQPRGERPGEVPPISSACEKQPSVRASGLPPASCSCSNTARAEPTSLARMHACQGVGGWEGGGSSEGREGWRASRGSARLQQRVLGRLRRRHVRGVQPAQAADSGRHGSLRVWLQLDRQRVDRDERGVQLASHAPRPLCWRHLPPTPARSAEETTGGDRISAISRRAPHHVTRRPLARRRRS